MPEDGKRVLLVIARRREDVGWANAIVSLHQRLVTVPSQILKDERLLEGRLKELAEAWEHWK